MQLVRKSNGHCRLVLERHDKRKLARGHVVHCYTAPHFMGGKAVVAALVEVPHCRKYVRLGYTLRAEFTIADFKQDTLGVGVFSEGN